MRDFVKPSDPILITIAKPVSPAKITSKEIQRIITEMLEVAFGEQQDRSKPVLVGLAAPQIGIAKRIILVDVAADGKGHVADLRVFINPEITNSSKETNEWYEGCFSTDTVCGIVSRPTNITISAFDEKGAKIMGEYTGYTARIFQHEIDHLNGIEFVKHIVDDKNLHWVEKDEFPLYRDKEAWRTWQKKCSRKQWQNIKSTQL